MDDGENTVRLILETGEGLDIAQYPVSLPCLTTVLTDGVSMRECCDTSLAAVGCTE